MQLNGQLETNQPAVNSGTFRILSSHSHSSSIVRASFSLKLLRLNTSNILHSWWMLIYNYYKLLLICNDQSRTIICMTAADFKISSLLYYFHPLLSVCANLRQSMSSFVISICPSAWIPARTGWIITKFNI